MVLVTGGAGYIGSHTVLELLNAGEKVAVVDNLCNSKEESLKRVEKITGKTLKFYNADVCDENALGNIFKGNPEIDGVIHFAGYKAVGESVQKPLMYYQNNLDSTITLLKAMRTANVKNIVFSSSATVYGADGALNEDMPIRSASSPYGNTKIICEQIIRDACRADTAINAALLRYFNPVGAHPSGLIGEDPQGIPNNLMPFITKVAIGALPELSIFGNDYPTRDGTCVRDYIHVVDLAVGHLYALKKLKQNPGVVVYNLGTGNGTTVSEMVSAFQKATGAKVPYKFAPRREGDLAECYAVTKKAEKELGWHATHTIEDMCRDHYNWQKQNPKGYAL